jgi:hypothetical protein
MIYWPAVLASSFVVALFLLVHRLFSGTDWRRVAHYLRVSWQKMDSEAQAFFLWLGRTVWVAVLLMAAKGW